MVYDDPEFMEGKPHPLEKLPMALVFIALVLCLATCIDDHNPQAVSARRKADSIPDTCRIPACYPDIKPPRPK